MKQDADFNVFSNEIKRQYDLLINFDDSRDTKVSIMLGFIMLILIQITLSKEFFDIIIQNKIPFYIFISGLMIILLAGVFGIIEYFVREYGCGPEIDDLINQYRWGVDRDFEKVISREIHECFNENRRISQDKVKYMKWMFIAFIIGLILIMISRITNMVI